MVTGDRFNCDLSIHKRVNGLTNGLANSRSKQMLTERHRCSLGRSFLLGRALVCLKIYFPRWHSQFSPSSLSKINDDAVSVVALTLSLIA